MDGVNTFKWMNREAMIKRGRRMMIAHNRGFIDEPGTLHKWFTREVSKYGSFGWSRHGKSANMRTIEDRFWYDCEKWMVTRYYGFEWKR